MNPKTKEQIANQIKNLISQKGVNEASTGDGGALVTQAILPEIFSNNFMENSIYNLCSIRDISPIPQANGALIIRSKETVRSALSGVDGGVIAHLFTPDGNSTTRESTPLFDQKSLTLNKLVVEIPATNAMLADATYLVSYLGETATESVNYYVDRNIIYGDGTTLNGIVVSGSNATITVTGSAPLNRNHLISMMGSFDYDNTSRSAWVMSHDVFTDILALSTLKYNEIDLTNKTLFGIPYMIKNSVNASELILGDFSQYVIVQKPLRETASSDFAFDKNLTVFHFGIRINGCPKRYAPVTDQAGDTNAPFVRLRLS